MSNKPVQEEQNPLVSELDVLHAYDPLGGFTFPGIWKQKKSQLNWKKELSCKLSSKSP